MRAIIFANGHMDGWPSGFQISQENDLIIAADGGFNHCKRFKIQPHIVVGDMDSLDCDLLDTKALGAVEVLRYPQEKDQTDLHLAIETAIRRHAEEIVILGALGGRWDMTIANALFLQNPILNRVKVVILDGPNELFCLKDHQQVWLESAPGTTLSLIPLGGPVRGVTLTGLEYPLNKETLPIGTTRGISNVFKEEKIGIEIESGCLLVVVTRAKITI